MKIQNLSFALFLFVFVSCAHKGSQFAGNPDILHLVVLHTNDTHGYGWPHLRSDGKLWGGFASQAKVVKDIREQIEKENGVLYLMSAGDVNTGVPESDLLDAEPDFFAMNEMGYDVMVLGNHEFDGGIEKIQKQKKWAKFPILSANVRLSPKAKSRYPLAPASILLEKNGFKLGVIGLTTDTLATLVLPKHVEKLEIEPVLKAAHREFLALKDKKADLVIALTHIGIGHGSAGHEKKIGTLDEALAQSEPEIALIVGGHSHTLLENGVRVQNTLIVQAGEKVEHLGRVDIYWDKTKGKVVESKATVIPLHPEDGQDPVVEKQMNAFKTRVGAALDNVVGNTNVLLEGDRHTVRYSESNLGNLVCDILRETTHADLAVYNGGGIRASIRKGKITLRDILIAFPFKNTIQTAKVTGKQIRVLLEQGLRNLETIGSFLHISGGSYKGQGGKITEIKIAGKAIEEDRTYVLATNSFVMSGGDYFGILTQAKDLHETGIAVDEAMIRYFKAHPQINPKTEGRIQIQK